MSLCQITIAGNATREPEFRQMDDGMVEVRLGIAVNWGRADRKETAFFDVSNRISMDVYQRTYYMYQNIKGKKVTAVGEFRPRKTQDGKTFLNVVYAKIELPHAEQQPQALPVSDGSQQDSGYEPEPQYQPPVQPQIQTPVQNQQPSVPPVPAGFPARPAASQQRTGNPLPPPPVGR